VFVGALDYRANIDGIEWFCARVWPDVRRQRPDATFHVVGSNPAASVHRLAGVAGVKIIGAVPDVRPHLTAATVVVVPLRIARGIQNKVLEAMAMGRAVVASPQALEGLQAEPGVNVIQAATPEEWTKAIIRLFGAPEERRRFGIAGREYVEQQHSWDVCLAPLTRLLQPDDVEVLG
jgi:glycosyltransferase involved in cell wall biosynthesis